MDITITLSEAQVQALETQRMQMRGPNMLPTSPDIRAFLAERISTQIVLPAIQQTQTATMISARAKLDAAQLEYSMEQSKQSQIEVK